MADDCDYFAWGANSYGQLSCGHKDDVLVPERSVEGCEVSKRVKVLTGGGGHTALITEFGELFMSGWNNKGQLGLGDTEDRTILCAVRGIPYVQDISCGWNHNLAITDGGLYVWGSNSFGQLGTATEGSQVTSPVVLQEFASQQVVSVGAGLRHSLVALADGSVWAWGANKKGQLGTGETGKNCPTPRRVRFPEHERVLQVVAGCHHSAALTDSGRVYCWGSNQHGQCGRPPSEAQTDRGKQNVTVPRLIKGSLSDVRVLQLESGWSHLLAVSDDSRVFTWGRADYGQLGTGDETVKRGYCSDATEVPALRGVRKVSCGAEHNMALSGNGEIVTWGWNEHGICGTGDETNVPEPGTVPKFKNLSVSLIGCGGGHSFVLIQR